MEELTERYQQLLEAYDRLGYMVEEFKERLPTDDQQALSKGLENEFVLHRDALIQRFSFCYELTWKFFKIILRDKHGLDVASPRSVFQESHRLKIINNEQVEVLLNMVKARNEIAHIYDEDLANDISVRIIKYFASLQSIARTLPSS